MEVETDNYTRFVYILTRIDDSKWGEDLIHKHVEHLKSLETDDILELAGPFTDHKGGMVILKNIKYDQAKTIAENDPFVSSGAESYELMTWELSCAENNHLGLG